MSTGKIIVIGFIIFCVIVAFSNMKCGRTDREKDEKATKECLKEKSENEKYKSIEEAITNYDFVTARKYLNCYQNTLYGNEDQRIGTENMYSSEDDNPYLFNLKKITRAEIVYLLDNGEFDKARSVASESDMMDIYNDKVPNLITSLLQSKNYEKVFSILTSWKFKTTFNPDGPANDSYYDGNKAYNSETQKYNDMVDNLLKHAIINDDQVTAKKCLPIYVPIAETDPKTKTKKDERDQKSVLKNEAKESAKQKMIAAGMKVN